MPQKTLKAGPLTIEVWDGQDRPGAGKEPDNEVWDIVVKFPQDEFFSDLSERIYLENKKNVDALIQKIRNNLSPHGEFGEYRFNSVYEYKSDPEGEERALPVYKTTKNGKPVSQAELEQRLEGIVAAFAKEHYPTASAARGSDRISTSPFAAR